MIINYYLTEIVYDYRNNVLIINEESGTIWYKSGTKKG